MAIIITKTEEKKFIHNGLEIKCEVFAKDYVTFVELNRLAIRLHDRKEQYVEDPQVKINDEQLIYYRIHNSALCNVPQKKNIL